MEGEAERRRKVDQAANERAARSYSAEVGARDLMEVPRS